jgi:hypothetical protein
MKHFHLSIAAISIIILVSACSGNGNSNNKQSSQPAQGEKKNETVLNEKLQQKLGSWITEGKECYGIVMTTPDSQGHATGKPVKCKVIDIKPDRIKVKAIENVKLMESKGCDKLGISYGETWWEEDGDLFQTRDEAQALLKSKGWSAE